MTLQPAFPSGLIEGSLHRFAVRAYFEDTDLSGVVYHANYLRWFERARSDFVRLLGIDQRSVNEAGIGAFAVADLAIRYAAPARLDDGVQIETRCTELGAASCRMQQKAIREEFEAEEAEYARQEERAALRANAPAFLFKESYSE